MEHAIGVCSPNEIMLNFCNYCRTTEELMDIIDHLNGLSKVSYLGFGPTSNDVLDISGMQLAQIIVLLTIKWVYDDAKSHI